MKKHPFMFLMICIVTGIIIGSLIGAAGVLKVFTEQTFMLITAILMKACLTIIAGIIVFLCLWGLIIKPKLDKIIMKKGIKTVGEIWGITAIPLPKELNENKYKQKARFVYTIMYTVDGKEIVKEFSPTCLTSREELDGILPIDEGEEIALKHLKRFPAMSIIDNETLYTAIKEERKEARIHLIMIPIITTIVYITLMILI